MGNMEPTFAGYRTISGDDGLAARTYWDQDACAYQHEHGKWLGHDDLMWCPEGIREAEARLLGDLQGRTVLEVGCGAAQCTSWVQQQGAQAVGIDVAIGMARFADGRALVSDARALPFANATFDTAFTAFGAISFVPDPHRIHLEVARVLRPGGKWVFSVPHPLLWGFGPEGDETGLTAMRPYFDRTPYIETDAAGKPVYAEYQHLLGDHIRALAGAGFRLLDLIEPEWTPNATTSFAGWNPIRAELLPATAIFVTKLS